MLTTVLQKMRTDSMSIPQDLIPEIMPVTNVIRAKVGFTKFTLLLMEDSVLLGYDAAFMGDWILTFLLAPITLQHEDTTLP